MKKKISVLIICAEYPPHVEGGLGIHYYELINELKNFCEVNIICVRTDKKTPNEEQYKNLNIYRIYTPNIFPLNHIVFNLKAFLKSRKINKDITHLCSPFGVLSALFKDKDSPLVVKIHSLYSVQKGNFLYNYIFFPLGSVIDRILIKKSDLVLTTSDFMKKDILERFNVEKNKVKVVHNGINKSFFNNKFNKKLLRKELNLPEDKKIILYVGRFVPRKGALNLVKAIPDVIKKYPNALFVFVGGGFDEGSWYEKIIIEYIGKNHLKNRTKIIPWGSRKDLIKYYCASDILIHPANYEPFGNIILEAMACGLPVMVSRSGGPEEIVAESGIILDKNTPNEISQAILKTINNKKKMEDLSKLSLKRVKHFSWKHNAENTFGFYERLLKK